MRIKVIVAACQLLLCSSVQAENSVSAHGGTTRPSVAQSIAPAPDVAPPVTAPPSQPFFLVTTTTGVEGYRIREYKGIVRGVMVRQPTVGQGLAADLERIVGGKVGAYLDMCDKGRQQSYDLCVEHARALGANAVLGMAYDSTAFEHGDDLEVEIVCYGTAVVLERAQASR